MQIKDVENLAELARLELSEEEKKEILKDMESILEYVQQIQEVEISDIKADFTLQNIWREDTILDANSLGASKFSRELIIEQFPDSKDGYLKVKKIL